MLPVWLFSAVTANPVGSDVQSVGDAEPPVELHLIESAVMFAREVLVTSPLAVNEVVIVGLTIVGADDMTTLPADPVIE